MRSEGGGIRAGGSWGGPGADFGRFRAGLGRSWGGPGRSGAAFWGVDGATWRQHGREKQQEREKTRLGQSVERPKSGWGTPRAAQREPKGEPNGAKVGVQIASKIEIDFQPIFDAKIVRYENPSRKIVNFETCCSKN